MKILIGGHEEAHPELTGACAGAPGPPRLQALFAVRELLAIERGAPELALVGRDAVARRPERWPQTRS